MTTARRVASRRDLRRFYAAGARVYRGNPLHRSTEDDVMRLLVERKSVYFRHAAIESYLLEEGREVVGRFSLIHDEKLPAYVQVAFFEALPGLHDVAGVIRAEAWRRFRQRPKIVVGLNGHLNYGAGLLADCFHAPPLFGYPYTPDYYLDYFASFDRKPMVSFRFEAGSFYRLRELMAASFKPRDVVVRQMNRKRFAEDVEIYTFLNNACFGEHPYWSDRATAEDFELFHPFRFLIKDENFLVAEHNGQPIGFLLWYPDFNELVHSDRELGVHDVLRYHARNPVRSVRLTEIAVLPQHRRRGADAAMILRMIESVEKGGYDYCEGGFIFEENLGSMALTLSYMRRALGRQPEPYRRFCVFEGSL